MHPPILYFGTRLREEIILEIRFSNTIHPITRVDNQRYKNRIINKEILLEFAYSPYERNLN